MLYFISNTLNFVKKLIGSSLFQLTIHEDLWFLSNGYMIAYGATGFI